MHTVVLLDHLIWDSAVRACSLVGSGTKAFS
jgi:hypothetical protein